MRISPINIRINKSNFSRTEKNPSFSDKSILESNKIYFGKDLVFQYSRETAIEYLSKSPTPVAQGTDGIIYKIGNVAIKVAKTKETSFDSEAEILKKLPPNLKNSQKFIDRFSFNGNDVLVSSFVEGTHKKALAPNDFPQIFQLIFEHDKANIIHGDLNVGNIVFSKNGEVSLIDYGAATQPSSTQVELYPDFVTNTNALKLENTGVCDSIKVWTKQGTEKENFRKYLSSKADFYSKHSTIVNNKTAREYEENLANVLKSPSDDVIETELTRLKTLDLLEMADTATNYDNNPYESIRLWNETVECAKAYEHEAQIKMSNAKTEEEKTYFNFQHEIAKCFHSTLSDWRVGTLNWLSEIKKPDFVPRTEIEQKIKENWNL